MTQTADVTGMTFALDADLESKFLDWIDEQNKLIVEEQLKSEEFNETQKEIQQMKKSKNHEKETEENMTCHTYMVGFDGWDNKIVFFFS